MVGQGLEMALMADKEESIHKQRPTLADLTEVRLSRWMIFPYILFFDILQLIVIYNP